MGESRAPVVIPQIKLTIRRTYTEIFYRLQRGCYICRALARRAPLDAIFREGLWY